MAICIPPPEKHWSKLLLVTWWQWVNRETDTYVRKHLFLLFLFTSSAAVTWMHCEHLHIKGWVKLFRTVYDVLMTVVLFAAKLLLCVGVYGRGWLAFPVFTDWSILWGKNTVLCCWDYFGCGLPAHMWHCAQVGSFCSFLCATVIEMILKRSADFSY